METFQLDRDLTQFSADQENAVELGFRHIEVSQKLQFRQNLRDFWLHLSQLQFCHHSKEDPLFPTTSRPR